MNEIDWRGAVAVKSLLLSACGALGLAAASAASAQAQPGSAAQPAPQNAPSSGNESTIEEIVVTAQKRSENLQDVPIAIAAFSGEALAAANVTAVSDLVTVTPSLRFQYAGPGGTTFLRGVGSAQSFAGAEAEVQTYIDNVYQPSGAIAYLKFNNIARVEVDKGPQGTLFGRNATGGVIQIFTRDPTQETKLDASVGYGKFDYKEADLYLTGGVTDQVAADIVVHFDDRDGWGRNTFLGTDAYASRSFGVRSKWIANLSDATRVTLIGDYSHDKSDVGPAFTLAIAPWRPTLATPVPIIPGKFTLTEDAQSNARITRYGGSLKLDTEIDDLSFVSVSAYRYSDSKSLLDADSTPFPVVIGAEVRTEKQWTQEFQLLSPSTGRFKWILGAYGFYNDAKEDPAQLSGTIASGFGAQTIQSFSSLKTTSLAGFGQATYDVTDTTHITAGLRYTHDHRKQDASSVFIYPAGPGAPPPFLNLNQNNFPTRSFNALTGKFTIAQDLSPDAMVYVGYSRGYKAGTFSNQLVLSNPAAALEPEHVDAIEGGLKSDLAGGRIRFNLAAFYYKYSNLQVNVFQAFRIVLQNSGSSEIKGLEGELQFALGDHTRLSAGGAYLDAKYKDFINAPLYTINPPNLPNPGQTVRGFGGIIIGQGDASGNRMPQAPEFSGYVGLNHTIESAVGDFNLNTTVNYQSRVYFTPDNLYSQGGYATISASAKWTAPSKKFDVTLWGRNLTDRRTFGALTVAGYRIAGTPNEPFSFGGRVGLHF